MIRSILWKEARQHGVTFVILTLGSLVVMLGAVGLASLDASFSRVQMLGMMAALILLLSMATSLLSGALLTGSDNEEKTRPWLDSLPGVPWKRWLTQVGFACMVQAAMMAIWGTVWLLVFWNDLDQKTPLRPLLTEAFFFTLAIASGLAWGQWGGNRSKSVFGGFGIGLVGLVAALCIFFVLQGLISFLCITSDRLSNANDYLSGRGLLVGVSTILLAIFFGIVLPLGRVASGYYRGSIRVSANRIQVLRSLARWVWIFCRTAWGPMLGLCILGILLGFFISKSFLIWPVWGLLVGVVCGLGVLGPDQDGERSFNGSLRAFRPWQFDLRVLPELVTSLLLLITPLVPTIVLAFVEEVLLTRRSESFEKGLASLTWEGVGILFPIGPWVVIWWSAGFGAALWTGLFFDKWIVSLVVSLGLGALTSSVWIPSLWGDDFSTWWPLGAMIVFWVLSRFLYRSFCAGTLAARGLPAFATMLVSLGLFIGLGLVCRFAFVPNPPPPFDIQATARTLVNPDGHLVDEITRHLPSNTIREPELQEFSGSAWAANVHKPVSEWEAREKEFFKNDYKQIRGEYTEKWPVPNELISFFVAYNSNLSEPNVNSLFNFNYQAHDFTRLRLMHALWQTTNGEQADFPGEVDRALYLAACIRHKGNLSYVQNGQALERFAFNIIENFLADGKPQDKVLAELAAVLDGHKVRMAKVESIPGEVGYYISVKALDNLIFATNPTFGYFYSDGSSGNTRLYWDLYNFAMKAPWEQERKRRLINIWYSGDVKSSYFPQSEDFRAGKWANANPVPYWHMNPLANSRTTPDQYWQDLIKREKTEIDLARVGIAAKRYQLANKSFPKSLANLAPKYLAEIPNDSFTGAALRFRIALALKEPSAEEKKKATQLKPSEAAGPGAGESAGRGAAGSSAGSLETIEPEDSVPSWARMTAGGMGMAGIDLDLPTPDPLSIVRGRELKALKPGTFVLWSIGPDGTDQGGIRDGGGYRFVPNQGRDSDDMFFLVGP